MSELCCTCLFDKDVVNWFELLYVVLTGGHNRKTEEFTLWNQLKTSLACT